MAPLFVCAELEPLLQAWLHKVAKCERAHDCFLLSCPQKRGIMSSKEIWETENWYGQRNKGE